LVLKGAWQAKSKGKGKRSAEDLMQYGRRQLHTENLQGGVQGTRARWSSGNESKVEFREREQENPVRSTRKRPSFKASSRELRGWIKRRKGIEEK